MNMTPAPDDLDPRRQALLLYFQGYRIARIAEMLGEKPATGEPVPDLVCYGWSEDSARLC